MTRFSRSPVGTRDEASSIEAARGLAGAVLGAAEADIGRAAEGIEEREVGRRRL